MWRTTLTIYIWRKINLGQNLFENDHFLSFTVDCIYANENWSYNASEKTFVSDLTPM